MRTYPDSEEDRKDAQDIKAEPWMVEALRMNPSYVAWGPHEDYMWRPGRDESAEDNPHKKDHGWESRVFVPRLADMWELNDLNEVVNFYFHIDRKSKTCEACDGSGYNPETKRIADNFYDHSAENGKGWHDAITQDEVQALVDHQRLHDFTSEFVPGEGWKRKPGNPVPTAAEVNARQRLVGLGSHDAINRWILIETRAKRTGVYGKCEPCGGRGSHYVEDTPRLCLTLWVLHPRKGCSRGVEIQRIERDEIPLAVEFLKVAAARNAERFSRLTA